MLLCRAVCPQGLGRCQQVRLLGASCLLVLPGGGLRRCRLVLPRGARCQPVLGCCLRVRHPRGMRCPQVLPNDLLRPRL